MKGNFNNRRRDHGTNNNASAAGTDRSGNQSGGSSTFYENAETTKGFNDRFDYLLANSIGSEAIATVTSGVKYSGLLAACNLESSNGVDIALKYPKVVDSAFGDNVDELTEQLEDTLLINGDDVAELELKGIDFTLDEKWENSKKQEIDEKQKKEKVGQDENAKKGFKTDVDISRGKSDIRERELQKWTPDADEDDLDVPNQTLEESSTTWDQFSVNEKKFGVKSTFDEHLYTTKINKNDPKYEQRLKEAERLAKEIESQGGSGNIHLAEDRGIIVDDSGMDEEDLYSGVDRRGNDLLAALKTNAKPSPAKPSKYIAPTLRNQPHNIDPAIISSTTEKHHFNKQVSSTSKDANATSDATKSKLKAGSPSSANETTTENSTSPISKSVPKKEALPTSKKSVSAKEAQFEELKKFSQKFKVPYDVPEDMKDILKNTILKGDPSLPPKPTSSNSNKSSVPPTPSSNKADLRKVTSNTKVGSLTQTPINSPSVSKANVSSRKRSAVSFFGVKVPHADNNKRESFNRNFNMFIKSKETYDEKVKKEAQKNSESKSMEQFFIEKPYFTAPTWVSTVEQSYKTLFPDERTALQMAQMSLQQRQMNSMSAAAAAAAANQQMGVVMGNMMRFPMAPGGSPSPMMNGMAGNMGMYMPFQPQPMFYPSMPHMMSMMGEDSRRSPSPQAASPQMPPAYINNAPGSSMGSFGYPGAMPFQPMMGGGGNNTYRQSYQHHNSHNNQHHHRNNHDNR